MAFARWDPVRDLLAIQSRFERRSSSAPQGWTPAVDLCETADAYVLSAEVPGIAREQMHLEVVDRTLTLHGHRDARVTCLQYHQVERAHGTFVRSFSFPTVIDAAGISADLRDGVLTITVPKAAEPGPRRVNVS